jgi:hypothetical protein
MDDQFINSMSDLVTQVATKKEATILKQLNWMLSRGLLKVIESDPVLVREADGTVAVRQDIELVSMEADYIQKLERENEDLRKFRDGFVALYDGLMKGNTDPE